MMVSSATSPAIERVKAGYDAKSIGADEDYIGIMSYDFHGAWDQVTGAQAPLYNKERVNGNASPLTDKVFPTNPSQVDDFTIIRGNEVWNDPFDKKTGTPFPRTNVGVPHQKIYTGFSTYGRGWTLPQPITRYVVISLLLYFSIHVLFIDIFFTFVVQVIQNLNTGPIPFAILQIQERFLRVVLVATATEQEM